jgi:hypothetical protein
MDAKNGNSQMKYCRITGTTGIGKSHSLNNFPATGHVQIIDLLVERGPIIHDDTKILVLDHADCELSTAKELISQAASTGVEYTLLVGQEPNDLFWPEITNAWDFEVFFKGGFRDLIIEVTANGKKKAYTADTLPRKLADIDHFLSQIKQDLLA